MVRRPASTGAAQSSTPGRGTCGRTCPPRSSHVRKRGHHRHSSGPTLLFLALFHAALPFSAPPLSPEALRHCAPSLISRAAVGAAAAFGTCTLCQARCEALPTSMAQQICAPPIFTDVARGLSRSPPRLLALQDPAPSSASSRGQNPLCVGLRCVLAGARLDVV